MLNIVDHRPWPLPRQPWVLRMTWYNLLFAHWACEPEELRKYIPCALELDTFDGLAYVGVIPFGMSGVAPRFCPDLPYFSRFLEINVRTYVRCRGNAGVYFFSLDAANPVAVSLCRTFFKLPYYNARMLMGSDGEWITCTSSRHHREAHSAEFAGLYRPVGEPFTAKAGSLDEWLTERYCLFTTDRKGAAYRCDIHHMPWRLQAAEAEILTNTMLQASGLTGLVDLSRTPRLLFARRLETVAWPLKQER